MFSAEDLCELLLSEQDVPSGLAPEGTEDEANRCLTGFRAGDGLPSVTSAAYLFANAEEARAAAESLRDGDAEFVTDAEKVDVPVGEGGFGLFRQHTASAPFAVVIYFWPVGNVVLEVAYNSDEKVDQRDVLALAETMQANAEELS